MKALDAAPQAVTKDEFKRAVHIVEEDDDVLIDAYLQAAQDVVETGTNHPLTLRNVEIAIRAGMGVRWWIPCSPVEEVSSIEWQEGATWHALDHSSVVLETAFDEPQLVLPSGFWAGVPDGASVRVRMLVGFEAAPKPLKQAVILIANDWLKAGIDPEHDGYTKVSFGCRALMRQAAYKRPQEWAAV